ncbi:BnaC05g44200D [Brassica napus]|uniref:BnaC05g44200D protein n=1 Tax=Brassica napus TaxID=3708 RepID=A0A078GTS8_BRANA|nr:BnaC05g44200D [Brassica napus]
MFFPHLARFYQSQQAF